jgi:hypothetical protein
MRAGALLLWFAVGLGIGVLGHHLSGSQSWYLALPVALVLGWWRVADPTRCEQRPADEDDRPLR